MVKRADLRRASGQEVRSLCRSGRWTDQTAGIAVGYYQANLVILPSDYADEFRAFCALNPQPCPLIDFTEPGDPEFRIAAPGSDVRTDLPRYCVYREGQLVEERADIMGLWREDHVAFVTGCTFSADLVLEEARIDFGAIDTPSGRFGAYRTNIACRPSGRLKGDMVVNARPVAPGSVERAAQVTARYPLAHGGPVHIGDPAEIGVDLAHPEWGEDRRVEGDFVPMFWACGVTAQQVAMDSRIPEMITHKAAHMFVTDLKIDSPQSEAIARGLLG